MSSRGYFWALLGGMAAVIVLFLLLEKPAAETKQPPTALQLSDVIDVETGKPLRPMTVNATDHIVRYANWDWVEQEDCIQYAPGSPDDGKKVPCGITDVVGITYPGENSAETCTLSTNGTLEKSPEFGSGFDAYATYSYFGGTARKGPLLNDEEECPTYTLVILPKDFVDNGAYVGEPTRQREALAAARALASASDESAASAD